MSMGKIIELVLDKLKELGKEKIKDWIGFNDLIAELKKNKELKLEIKNNLSQNQTQSLINNNGISSEKYIAVLEKNNKLKSELHNFKKNTKKIKITKAEHEVYKEILKYGSGVFYSWNVIINYDIFSQLRSKEIIKKSDYGVDYFEVVIFEKDFEIVEE